MIMHQGVGIVMELAYKNDKLRNLCENPKYKNELIKKYGELFGIDLVLNHNDILKTNSLTGTHCIIITGVNIVDGKPNRWKLENSWGEKYGKNGYYVATNEYMDRYVYRAIINKKYLNNVKIIRKRTNYDF